MRIFSSPESLVLSTFYRYRDSEIKKLAQVTELTRSLSDYKIHSLSTRYHLPSNFTLFSQTLGIQI